MNLGKMINTQCQICGNNDHTVVKFPVNFDLNKVDAEIFSARRTSEHYHYRILECKKCTQVFSSPVLPFEKISELYLKSKLTYDNETEDIANTYIQYIQKNPSIFHSKEKALEIGCGNGFFLQKLKKEGYKQVFGVEPSKDAVEKAGDLIPNIFCDVFENIDFKQNDFDLICCFQTLDHIIDPLALLKRALTILKPGGIFYIIVHNEKALQARIFGEKSPIYDVEHIYLFNKNTLSELSRKAGFKIIKVFDIENIYPLKYWVRMAPLPFKRTFLKILKITKLENKKLSIKPGNLGIFIQKPF